MNRQTVLLALLLFACGSVAQVLPDKPLGAHNHAVAMSSDQDSAGIIDGAANPELIPDSTAYRLFFVVVAQNEDATPEQKVLQQVRLRKALLNPKDMQLTITVLQTFKVQYADLIRQYNDSAEAALSQGQAPDYDAFVLRRNALVGDTRNRLRHELSNEGMARLNQLIMSEKRNMKVMPRSNKSIQ